MALNFEDTLKQLTDFLKTEASTQTVIGQSFQLGEFTCLPIIKFGLGLGYGGGEGHGGMEGKNKGEGTGVGGGAGMGIAPIGFLVTRGDQISFISTEAKKGLGAMFDKVPDLLEKMMDKKKNGKEVPVA
ncbi:GerW family sporulation protein [Ferruginibacter paludis]|uniref:GerW family sporulation protein n=1 Tax=Ferruginibacter paludis TaxID=1310417 RepID=UPI0025B2B374|nr:GerW family sporulation protein [Ferruginibacter paludis]MDN3655272.1 GerW family sporulation protein [Ferruginibacter paludis]